MPEDLELWIKPSEKKPKTKNYPKIKQTQNNKTPAGNFTQAHYFDKKEKRKRNTTHTQHKRMKVMINGKLCKKWFPYLLSPLE